MIDTAIKFQVTLWLLIDDNGSVTPYTSEDAAQKQWRADAEKEWREYYKGEPPVNNDDLCNELSAKDCGWGVVEAHTIEVEIPGRPISALLAAALTVVEKCEHPTKRVTIFDQVNLREAIDGAITTGLLPDLRYRLISDLTDKLAELTDELENDIPLHIYEPDNIPPDAPQLAMISSARALIERAAATRDNSPATIGLAKALRDLLSLTQPGLVEFNDRHINAAIKAAEEQLALHAPKTAGA